MGNSVSIKKLMTVKVISVSPEMPLMEAASILLKNNFNGLPVINKNGKIAGILTEYDLMIGGSSIHLPTLLKLINEFDIYRKDKKFIREDLKKIAALKVSDVMSFSPLTLQDDCSASDAIKAFSEHKDVNPILVSDKSNNLAGIISRYDIVKLLGGPSISSDKFHSERQIDKNIEKFLRNFERKFVLVNKARTNYWLILSLFFAIIGFIVAFFVMLRISMD